MGKINLTEGSVLKNLIRFSLPYLLSCFLQTFYGLVDLFVTGQYNGAAAITAVSIGSQVTHMITVIVVGMAMGVTVTVSRAIGAGDKRTVAGGIGNSVVIFSVFALILTLVLLACSDGIIGLLSTPSESLLDTKYYLTVCFAGIPFITAYNVISSIFRGLGDTKSPMYFVIISGIANIGLDYLLIGGMDMGAFGAAVATVISQALSVVLALVYMKKKLVRIEITKQDFRIRRKVCSDIIRVGLPVSVQDGFIQVAFLVITVIANRRGVDVAAAVGIVEKVICFMFLVPSAMLSSVSAIAACNAGAEKHNRAAKTLFYAIGICVGVGCLFTVVCEIWAEEILMLFAREEEAVILMGGQYLRAYVFDCIAAGIHFCFSGYFCAYKKSVISFWHNLASILLVRIPGAYLASVYFTETLFPMGLAAPLGSLLSAIICVAVYCRLKKNISAL